MESAEPSKVQHKKSDHAPGGQSGTRSEYRAVYLLVWPNPIFKAHWAFFIPNADDRTVRKGNYIHVNGNVHDGYQIEFVHGYDVNLTTHRPLPPIEIGRVRADLLHAENQSDSSTYETPSDDIERLIAAVPAPEASLRSAGMGSTVSLTFCKSIYFNSLVLCRTV